MLIAVAIVWGTFAWVERERNKQEEYKVYSAYLSEGLLNDPHDWSTGARVQVVVGNRTISGGNLRLLAFSLFDKRVHFKSTTVTMNVNLFTFAKV